MRLAEQMEMQFSQDEYVLISMEIAHHVRKLEAASSSQWCDLIDSLLPRIPYAALAWAKQTVPAFAIWPPSRDRLVILIFTISEGLHAYVARQLDSDPGFRKPLPRELSLLYCALRGVLGRRSESDQEAGGDPDAILKTVHIILSRGASPNQALTIGGTPWTHLMAVIKEGRRDENDRWVGIVAALIEAGACEHASDVETDLPLSKFSPPQQRRLAFIRQTATARGFAAWHTRHFMCHLVIARKRAMAELRPFMLWMWHPIVYVFNNYDGEFTGIILFFLVPAVVVLLGVWMVYPTALVDMIENVSSRLGDTLLAIILTVASSVLFFGLFFLFLTAAKATSFLPDRNSLD